MPAPDRTSPVRRRPLLGGLCLVLGVIGAIGGIAGVIGTWIVSGNLRAAADGIAGGVTGIVARIDVGAGEFETRVGEARGRMTQIRAEVEREIARRIAGTLLEDTKLKSVVVQVEAIRERLRDWRDLVDSMGELLTVLDESLETTGALLKLEGNTREQLSAAMADGTTRIDEVLARVAELEGAVMALLDETDAEKEAEEALPPLFERIDGALGELQQQTKTFSAALENLEEQVDAKRAQVARRIFMGGLVVTALLLWQSVAQLCLARVGRSLLTVREPGSREVSPKMS